MESKQKKIAAAVSGVIAYIKTEEDVLYAQQIGASAAGRAAAPPPAPVKLWGISGRQEQMHLRGLMQLRSFKGTPFR